jgi:UDP-glucose 4-epimerase
MGLSPEFDLGASNQGWIGDNPFIHLDNSKMKSLGWIHSNSIRSSVEDTVDWLTENQWALDLAILDK